MPPKIIGPHVRDRPAPSRDSIENVRIRTPLDAAFRRESSNLLRYLDKHAGRDAAPDILQEVFTRAVASSQASSLRNPAAFLQRIARNLLIDRSRRRKTAGCVHLELDEELHGATLPEQEAQWHASDLLSAYERAVDDLPEKTRRVFLMHRVDELSYRDIHEQLGISIATVEYHMMKALGHIARAVDAAR